MENFSRYERQWILKEIGFEGQKKLQVSSVVVVGLGALGSVSSQILARAGVGKLTLIDRDFLEINNLQRQVLYEEADVRDHLPKAIAAARKLGKINSEIVIEAHTSDVNAETIEELLEGSDLIVDGTDNFETRFLLNDYALKKNIPWIYGGAVKTEGMAYVILPGEGACLRCLYPQAPPPGQFQTCDQVGVLASAAHMIASFQAAEAIKILTGNQRQVSRKLWKMDLWNTRFEGLGVLSLAEDRCDGCRNKNFPYLTREAGMRTVTLCGRNAVQIYQSHTAEINFKELAARLAGRAEVEYNDYVLNILPESYRITVFLDGRAIVKGTEDAGKAKSLYAKYVGS